MKKYISFHANASQKRGANLLLGLNHEGVTGTVAAACLIQYVIRSYITTLRKDTGYWLRRQQLLTDPDAMQDS